MQTFTTENNPTQQSSSNSYLQDLRRYTNSLHLDPNSVRPADGNPYGDPKRFFLVKSETNPFVEYFVDTYPFSARPYGTCDCPDFMYNAADNGFRCKHLWLVLRIKIEQANQQQNNQQVQDSNPNYVFGDFSPEENDYDYEEDYEYDYDEDDDEYYEDDEDGVDDETDTGPVVFESIALFTKALSVTTLMNILNELEEEYSESGQLFVGPYSDSKGFSALTVAIVRNQE